MALGLQSREVVIADDSKVEAPVFGEGDVPHQLFGPACSHMIVYPISAISYVTDPPGRALRP
jgi:hypothetical protein